MRSAASDALVEMAARGDRHAFEELVESRVDRIFRTASAILGNEAYARDATQEAFIAAWQQHQWAVDRLSRHARRAESRIRRWRDRGRRVGRGAIRRGR